MEPKARAFLIKVGRSLSLGFIWLALTCIFAIKGDNAFINGPVHIRNVLFYAWFVSSIIALIFLYKKIWKEEMTEDQK